MLLAFQVTQVSAQTRRRLKAQKSPQKQIPIATTVKGILRLQLSGRIILNLQPLKLQ